jgi:rhodanese-related sulfurtransferase
MTPVDLAVLIREGRSPVVLDVRSGAEYERGHVPGARHVPFWQWRTLRALAAAADREIVVYCGHGPRAWLAAAVLRGADAQVSLLAGHMAAWYRARLTIERRGTDG